MLASRPISNLGQRDQPQAPLAEHRVALVCSPQRRQADFLLGTFLPFARASDSPIAIACFLLLTVLPLLPLLSVPALRRSMDPSHHRMRTWNIEPSSLSFFRIRKNADSLRKFRRNKRRWSTSLRDDSSIALRIEPNARVLAPKLCSVRAGSCTKRKQAGGTRAIKWS